MRYEPAETAGINTLDSLLEYIIRENRQIAIALAGVSENPMEELHVAPARVKEFMIVAADGTDWNPGAGKGVYAYYSGTWNKLG
jgi:hypothetical protein